MQKEKALVEEALEAEASQEEQASKAEEVLEEEEQEAHKTTAILPAQQPSSS